VESGQSLIFGLFGSEQQRSAGSGTFYTCRDKEAINYKYYGEHRQSYCEYEPKDDSDAMEAQDAEVVVDQVEEQELTTQKTVQTSGGSLEALVSKYREKLIMARDMGLILPDSILILLEDFSDSETGHEVRDLEYGMQGEDVRKLQTVLINEGYEIPDGPSIYFRNQTKMALAQYQADNGIYPSVGYFGSITRKQMKDSGVEGLWW